jgi:AraC-like DNA-binding protein
LIVSPHNEGRPALTQQNGGLTIAHSDDVPAWNGSTRARSGRLMEFCSKDLDRTNHNPTIFAVKKVAFFVHPLKSDTHMKSEEKLYRVKSIHELHAIAGFDKPKHALITIMDYSKVDMDNAPEAGRFVCEFYSVNFKNHCSFIYGNQHFDHQEGTLLCTAPEQVITMRKPEGASETAGWGLFFHPEFIRNSSLGKKIDTYTFFRYEEHEALHLSGDEKQILVTLLRQIEKEYLTNIDQHSHSILISNLELLLNYCTRFYNRQFITRTNHHKDLLLKFEQLLSSYFHSGTGKNMGLPTVAYCAEKMNLSASYFSDLLKNETGKTAQEHIHYHLLEKAKTLLLSTDQSVNEIAMELGFEYPQNLTKLFKNKTGTTPTAYRKIQAAHN